MNIDTDEINKLFDMCKKRDLSLSFYVSSKEGFHVDYEDQKIMAHGFNKGCIYE